SQVFEKDGEYEHDSQCEKTQREIPEHIVNEDMPPVITLYENSLADILAVNSLSIAASTDHSQRWRAGATIRAKAPTASAILLPPLCLALVPA
ncbi:hypothetical protein A6R68_21969, partial [Neotoma lepida]